MSIISILNQIKNDEVVLPAIQRDFVWSEERTETLLDSIMRGYPIGIVLLWETYEDIQYRNFVPDFRSGSSYTFRDNPERKRLKLVLDGQQRLQSLYIALYGSLEGKYLHFDLLSGLDSDDVAEDKFVFKFLGLPRTKGTLQATKSAGPGSKERPTHYWRMAELFKLGARGKFGLVERLSKQLTLKRVDRQRLDLNLNTLERALSLDENILKVSTIDEDQPADSPNRKSESDVLEIFVRINRQGTPLSRSDLIFSMLKLNWRESAEALPEFLRTINEGNSFELDNDFVIRSLFAVSDLGTKLDLDLLRKKSNANKLRTNFDQCCKAISAAVDFVQTECRCLSSSLLGGSSTLIPLVYYLFHSKNHEVRNDQVDNVRKAVLLFGLARPFSRWGESRLGAFIREELKPRQQRRDATFPIDSAVEWVQYWEKIGSYDDLIQANHLLTLHLVQGLVGARVKYERDAPQVDHIFPRSELRKRRYSEELVNDVANFWILAAGKNQNKSNKPPREYFADVGTATLQKAAIKRELLDYRQYKVFLKTRRKELVGRMNKLLGIDSRDLA